METAYTNSIHGEFFLNHKYGENIHISKDIMLHKILAKLSHPETTQPLFNTYLNKAYDILFHQVLSREFQSQNIEQKTRMYEFTQEAIYKGDVLSEDSKVICVDLARAGMIPTQNIFELCNLLFTPQSIRQDHIYAQRIVDNNQHVTGVDFSGSKIGGDKDDSYVLLADPMGATGGTIDEALKFYKKEIKGNAKKYISIHLMITPEFITKLQASHPELIIYAGRIDRGLSSEKALNSIPGEFINEEKGLNDIQYIVPGAGGIGELINNSFV